jgi:hypothetical protein
MWKPGNSQSGRWNSKPPPIVAPNLTGGGDGGFAKIDLHSLMQDRQAGHTVKTEIGRRKKTQFA